MGNKERETEGTKEEEGSRKTLYCSNNKCMGPVMYVNPSSIDPLQNRATNKTDMIIIKKGAE